MLYNYIKIFFKFLNFNFSKLKTGLFSYFLNLLSKLLINILSFKNWFILLFSLLFFLIWFFTKKKLFTFFNLYLFTPENFYLGILLDGASSFLSLLVLSFLIFLLIEFFINKNKLSKLKKFSVYPSIADTIFNLSSEKTLRFSYLTILSLIFILFFENFIISVIFLSKKFKNLIHSIFFIFTWFFIFLIIYIIILFIKFYIIKFLIFFFIFFFFIFLFFNKFLKIFFMHIICLLLISIFNKMDYFIYAEKK